MVKKIIIYGKTRIIPLLGTQLNLASWLVRAKVRKFVLLNIDKMTTPSELVNKMAGVRKSSSYYSQISRALAELKKQGLIKCLNPVEKTGRFYTLTDKGKQLLKYLKLL